jgi:transcription elongation GreA/GreB family factor
MQEELRWVNRKYRELETGRQQDYRENMDRAVNLLYEKI